MVYFTLFAQYKVVLGVSSSERFFIGAFPGPIVSPTRHSLKNESEYDRSYSYANKWAGYSAI